MVEFAAGHALLVLRNLHVCLWNCEDLALDLGAGVMAMKPMWINKHMSK
jgi:hypothetical protein